MKWWIKKQPDVKQKLSHLLHVPFNFNPNGSQIIFHDQHKEYKEEEKSQKENTHFPFVEVHVHWIAGWLFRDLGDIQQTEKHATAQLQIALEIGPLKVGADFLPEMHRGTSPQWRWITIGVPIINDNK